jgi:hypothetical protein
MSPSPAASGPSEGNDAAALLKLAVQGSPVRFTAAEIEDLNKDIEEGRKGLDKVRAFKLEASVVTARCRIGDEQPWIRLVIPARVQFSTAGSS